MVGQITRSVECTDTFKRGAYFKPANRLTKEMEITNSVHERYLEKNRFL